MLKNEIVKRNRCIFHCFHSKTQRGIPTRGNPHSHQIKLGKFPVPKTEKVWWECRFQVKFTFFHRIWRRNANFHSILDEFLLPTVRMFTNLTRFPEVRSASPFLSISRNTIGPYTRTKSYDLQIDFICRCFHAKLHKFRSNFVFHCFKTVPSLEFPAEGCQPRIHPDVHHLFYLLYDSPKPTFKQKNYVFTWIQRASIDFFCMHFTI